MRHRKPLYIEELTKHFSYKNDDGSTTSYTRYTYICDVCGRKYDKRYPVNRKPAYTKQPTIDFSKPCKYCAVSCVNNKRITTFLNNIIKHKDLYIINRIKGKKRTVIRFLNKLIEEVLKIDSKEIDENLTIGLKNPFKRDILKLEDFELKLVKQDILDRERYLNDISQYENTPISKKSFEKICIKQNLDINDFSEIRSEISKSKDDLNYYVAKHINIYK